MRLSLLSCGFFFFKTALAFSFSFPLPSAAPDESWLSDFFVNLFRTLPAALSIEPVSDRRLSLEVLLGGPGPSWLLWGWLAPLVTSCLFSFTGTKDPLCSRRDGGGLVAVADWTLATDTSLTLRSGGACDQLALVQHYSVVRGSLSVSTYLTTDVGVQFLFEHVGSHRFRQIVIHTSSQALFSVALYCACCHRNHQNLADRLD